MKPTWLAALALLAASAATLRAESVGETWDPPSEYRETHIGEKLLGIGFSVGATVLPAVAAVAISEASNDNEHTRLIATLGLGGLLVGPSVGQFYAGSPGLGLLGIGVRTAGAVAVVAGVAAAIGDMFCGMDFGGAPDDRDCSGGSDGEGAILAGLIIYGGGTAFSLATIPWAVDRKHRPRRSSAWEWTPTLALASGGDIRPGAAMRLRF